uniref:Ubiquitin-like domain-containing protein n=1 Tax=Kryptolebias marmoratus TaxID=37003 RepID=A0A3Q3AHY6_KRYMA
MENIRVFVRGLDRKMAVFDLGNPEEMQKMTVLQLKEKILVTEIIMGNSGQWLIFNGRQMKDSEMLSEYGVNHGGVIQLAVKLHGGGETRRSIENLHIRTL